MQENSERIVKDYLLKKFCSQILQKVGVIEADSDLVADSLVFANLRGTDSHGVSRLGLYVKRIENKVMKPRPTMSIVRDRGGTILVDGDDGMGQVAAGYAVNLAIERASETGISLVGVRNSGHLGTLAYWPMMVLSHNMIGICTTNTSPMIPPWGGKEPVLGNNPIAITAPTGKDFPLVLDMAISVTARGNIILAEKKGEKIPAGWALDKSGQSTQDPKKALEGSILALGGYKGVGLAIMIDVLTGVLMRSAFGRDCAMTVPLDLTKPFGFANLIIAIRIENFLPMEEFHDRIGDLIQQIKQCPLANGFDEILLPGEKEFLVEKKRKQEGIPLTEPILRELDLLANKFHQPPLW